MLQLLARWVFGRTDGARVPLLSWPIALLIVLALHVAAVRTLDGLTINNSAEAYYPKEAAAVVLRDRLRQDFPGDEVLTVLFRGDDLYGREFLTRLRSLSDKIESHELVDRVISIMSMERISGSADGFAVEPLIDKRRLQSSSPEALKQRVLSDRFAPGTLASLDGKHLAVVVRPKPLSQSAERVQLSLTVAQAIQELGLRSYYAGEAGPVTMDVEQLQSILSDSARFVPLTVGLALALLFWVTGAWRPVLLGGLAISTVVLPTVAAVAASGEPYTMVSAILPSLLSAYTVVTLLHLYAGIQRAQRQGADTVGAVDKAILDTYKPAIFNVLTTSAGLLSLLFVPIPPIRLFGLVGAAGTLIVLVTVYVLMPPLLRRWDRKPWSQRGSGLGLLGRVSKWLTMFSLRRPVPVLVVFGIGVVALLPQALKVQVETDMLRFFAPSHPINVSTRLIESTLVGVTTLEISLQAESQDAFQSVRTLQEVKALQDWLEAQPGVDKVSSMVDLVEEMHWAMNRERADFRAVPPNDRLLRQYLLVYDGRDLHEMVDRDFQHARILVNLHVHGTTDIAAAVEKIRQRVQAQPLAGIKVDVGGYGRLIADQIDLLINGQTGSFVGAFVQIYLFMVLLWRAPVGAALCMVPNLAPLLFIFVLMGFAAISLDSATVMVASVVLGITVDDTIHLYHGVLHRLKAGMSPAFAIVRSYEATGRAVLATAIILIGQFLLLASSEFVPTANFGLMTATALASGLLFELLLLPALLILWHGRGSRRALRRRTVEPRQAHNDSEPAQLAMDSLPHEPGPPLRAAPDSVAFQGACHHVLVCHGVDCKKAGAASVWKRLREEQKRLPQGALRLTRTSCLGPCRYAPVVQVYPQGTLYGLLEGDTLEQVINGHLRAGIPVSALALPMQQPEDRQGGSSSPS